MTKKMKEQIQKDMQAAVEENVTSMTASELKDVTIPGVGVRTLHVKRFISAAEAREFVKAIRNDVLKDDDGYLPELWDYAVRKAILQFYAECPVSDSEEDVWALVWGSDVYARVVAQADRDQIASLVASARSGIDHELRTREGVAGYGAAHVMAALETMMEQTQNAIDALGGKEYMDIMQRIMNVDALAKMRDDAEAQIVSEALNRKE